MSYDEENIARKNTIDTIIKSVPSHKWKAIQEEIDGLRSRMKRHSLFNHPMIERLNKDQVSLDSIRKIHLEYEYAIVEIFTDALLMAQYQAKKLDKVINPSFKMHPRFLLLFNIADEFGMYDSLNTKVVSSNNSHFCLYKKVLSDLNITPELNKKYQPTKESKELREFLENNYDSYIKLVLLLAVAEQQVITFSPPLRNAVKQQGVSIDNGYYFVHGSTHESLSDAADDLHEDDLWILVTHALCCLEYSIESTDKIISEYCDLWDSFWTAMEII